MEEHPLVRHGEAEEITDLLRLEAILVTEHEDGTLAGRERGDGCREDADDDEHYPEQ